MAKLLKYIFAPLFLLVMLFAGAAQAQTTALRLGQSLPLSGALAELGTEYRDGMLAYFKVLNSRGGVHGRRIELVTLDDGYVVERSVENAKKLLDQEDVFAFIGMFGSANYGALIPLINERGIPSLAPYSGSDELRAQKAPTTFWLRASYGDESEKIVDQLTTLGIERIAVFYQNDAFGKAGLAGVELALVGIAISQVVPYPWSGTKPVVREFMGLPKAFQPAAGASYTTLEGYLAAKIMVEALNRAGPQASRDKLLAALDSMRPYDTGGFTVSYSGKERLGSRFVEVTIVGNGGRLMH